jgi:hypothetical protein
MPHSFSSESGNPYAAPATEIGPPDSLASTGVTEAEAIRLAYLAHEASIRAVALIGFGVAAFFLASGLFLLALFFEFGSAPGRTSWDELPLMIAIVGGNLTMAVLAFHLGRGLRRLRSWARWTCVVISAIVAMMFLGGAAWVWLFVPGLPASPFIVFGLLVGIFLLTLISRKSAFLFSPRYQEIIALTPHVHFGLGVWPQSRRPPDRDS